MTLLVGARYPWSHLFDWPIFRSLPDMLKPAAGVIIAADSRWTYPSGRTEDGAVKLFGVGSNGLAAYAGSVVAGEDAIANLATRLTPGGTLAQWGARVQNLIEQSWDLHRPNDDGLELLFGFSQETGYAWLGRFSSLDGFVPREIDDVEAVGPERARVFFRQTLRAVTIENMNRLGFNALTYEVQSWGSLFMIAINEACELGAHESVGGKVICGVSTLGRAQGVGTTRVSSSPSGLMAHEIGLEDEGRTLKSVWTYHPPHDDSV